MANQQPRLTTGCLERVLRGTMVERPVLQVLGIKKIQSGQQGGASTAPSTDRYRLQMSDGDKYQPCMLASQMNSKVQSKEIHTHCVVMFTRYTCNTIHERRIIIIVDMTVLMSGEDVGGPIGKPTMLDIVRVDPSNQTPMTTNSGRGFQGKGVDQFRPPQHNRPAPFSGSSGGAPSRTFNGSVKQEGSSDGGVLCHQDIFPISSLSPYQSRWTIRARVASKPSIRTWSNSRGEGRVFSVNLVDDSGEIKASGFNQVADKLHPVFQMGKVFYVSKGRLKPANPQFNTTNNQYELSLNEDTLVEECTDAASEALPTIKYNFRPISEIESIEPNSLIDVIGVVRDVAEITSIITKRNNQKLNKRELFILDRSGHVVSCTLWGAEAEEFDGTNFPVVAVKGAKVSDFGGRSLSTVFSSVIVVNPDLPEAHTLRGWYDSVGKNEKTQSISGRGGGGGGPMDTPFLILSQVKELDLGHNEKPDYFNCKGTVAFARKESCLYKACPSPDCNKKVTESSGGGEYFCEKCNQNFAEFKYRIILTVNVADHSGSHWLTCFQDTATEVLGTDAEQLGILRDSDEAAFDEVFQRANFKDFTFKVRAKMDMFNDEQRLKCYCVNACPLDYAQESRKRVDDIKRLMAK